MTQQLQHAETLGGNCLTTMIGTVRQGEWDRSLATLKHLVAAQQVTHKSACSHQQHEISPRMQTACVYEATVPLFPGVYYIPRIGPFRNLESVMIAMKLPLYEMRSFSGLLSPLILWCRHTKPEPVTELDKAVNKVLYSVKSVKITPPAAAFSLCYFTVDIMQHRSACLSSCHRSMH